MSEQANLQKVRELYAAFGRGDVPALLEALDPEIVWENPGPAEFRYFGRHQGRAAVAANVFAFLGEQLDMQVFEPRNLFASGDTVVVLIHAEAVARKTGKRVVQDIAHAFTFRNGRPVHFHDYQDSAQVAEALR
jgi:ketosteroid isomerase-like protein